MQDAAPKEREGLRLCRSLGGDPPFPRVGLLVWLRGMRNGLRTYHMPKPKVVLTDSYARRASIGLASSARDDGWKTSLVPPVAWSIPSFQSSGKSKTIVHKWKRKQTGVGWHGMVTG